MYHDSGIEGKVIMGMSSTPIRIVETYHAIQTMLILRNA